MSSEFVSESGVDANISAQQRNVLIRNARRVAIFVAGWLVVAAGVAMLVLPGPGLVVIVAGLSILAVEFSWARRWRDKANEKARAAASKSKELVRRKR